MHIRFNRLLVACLLAAVAGIGNASEVLRGKVVKIADGDTLTLLTSDKQQVKVRLAQIDTPERGQPWGSRAKQALSAKVFGESITVEVKTNDRYGRSVGEIYKGDRWINAELVAEGHAWVYRRYMDDDELLDLEEMARSDRRGLWSLPDTQRIPPWKWRIGSNNS